MAYIEIAPLRRIVKTELARQHREQVRMIVLHGENDEVSDNENKLNTEPQQRTMMSDERIDNQKRRRQRVKVKRSKVFPVISKLNTCLVL
jgi:hypothetical protein